LFCPGGFTGTGKGERGDREKRSPAKTARDRNSWMK